MIAELLHQVKISRRRALRETGLRREYWFENARRLLGLVREIKTKELAQ